MMTNCFTLLISSDLARRGSKHRKQVNIDLTENHREHNQDTKTIVLSRVAHMSPFSAVIWVNMGFVLLSGDFAE